MINELHKQAAGLSDVEVLYLGDNKRRTVGRKRNDLVALAQGQYVCFLDDDDRIAPDFVTKILEQIDGTTDVVCYNVACTIDKSAPKTVYYSKDFFADKNYPGHYERLPNHLMVVRRELARQVPFLDKSCGEDSDYAIRLQPLLKTQKIINEILYFYDFSHWTTETQ
jgi:glycosyltransferase involved in cell wall biosynthesis